MNNPSFFERINELKATIKLNQKDFYGMLLRHTKKFNDEFRKPKPDFLDRWFNNNKPALEQIVPLTGQFSTYSLISFKDASGKNNHRYFIFPTSNGSITEGTANSVIWAIPIEPQNGYFAIKFSMLYKIKIIDYIKFVNPTNKQPNQPEPSSIFNKMLYPNEPFYCYKRNMTNDEQENAGVLDPRGNLDTTYYSSTEKYFIVSLYYDGMPLDKYIENKSIIKHLSISQKIKLMANLAHELSILHLHEYIHRDVKPANFLVDPATLSIMFIDGEQPSTIYHRTANQTVGTTISFLAPWIGREDTRNYISPPSSPPCSRNPIRIRIKPEQSLQMVFNHCPLLFSNDSDQKEFFNRIDLIQVSSRLYAVAHLPKKAVQPLSSRPSLQAGQAIGMAADTFALGLIFVQIIVGLNLDELLSPENILQWTAYQEESSAKKSRPAYTELVFDQIEYFFNTFTKTTVPFNYQTELNKIHLLVLNMINPDQNKVPPILTVFQQLYELLPKPIEYSVTNYLNKITFVDSDCAVFNTINQNIPQAQLDQMIKRKPHAARIIGNHINLERDTPNDYTYSGVTPNGEFDPFSNHG